MLFNGNSLTAALIDRIDREMNFTAESESPLGWEQSGF
jgi:hypothetical protein